MPLEGTIHVEKSGYEHAGPALDAIGVKNCKLGIYISSLY